MCNYNKIKAGMRRFSLLLHYHVKLINNTSKLCLTFINRLNDMFEQMSKICLYFYIDKSHKKLIKLRHNVIHFLSNLVLIYNFIQKINRSKCAFSGY